MAGQLDMQNRDPNGLNQHIQELFEEQTVTMATVFLQVQHSDVFGEPDGVRSMDCVWSNSYTCFECCKGLCYQIMTLFCGVCIAMEWGCEFAMLAFNHVWIWTPCMRDFSITAGCCQKCFGTFLNCCCSPLFETMGMCFSNIKITKS